MCALQISFSKANVRLSVRERAILNIRNLNMYQVRFQCVFRIIQSFQPEDNPVDVLDRITASKDVRNERQTLVQSPTKA